MKKFILTLLFLLGLAFIIASHFAGLRQFKKFPLNKLIFEKTRYEVVIGELKQRLEYQVESSEGLSRELTEKAESLTLIEREIFLKRYHIDAIVGLVALLSLVGLLLLQFRGRLKGKPKTVDSIIEDIDVGEDSPKEMYVDEWEFQHKSENGFKTKREAVEWLKMDPSLKCDYCGSRLRPTLTGKKEAVQLVTFYKKVPEGAKDLRVVLGTFWFTNPATELKCPQCERVVRR